MPRPGDTALAAPDRSPDRSTVFRPRYDLNLKVTLMWVKTSQRRKGVGWWATETPDGPASVAFRAVGGEVLADAWGTGAEWAIDPGAGAARRRRRSQRLPPPASGGA